MPLPTFLSDILTGFSSLGQSAKKTVNTVFAIPTREELLAQIRSETPRTEPLKEELKTAKGGTTPNILETATPEERKQILSKEAGYLVFRPNDTSPAIGIPTGGLQNIGRNIISKLLKGGKGVVEKAKPAIQEVLEKTPATKLTEAIKTATPLRKQIETAQSAERAKRFAIASDVQSKTGGQSGYFSGLSKLKGELLKEEPTFTPPKKTMSQEEMDALYTTVQRHPVLNYGEQLSGQRGLTKLLDGHVPVPSEVAVLEEVFGTDMVKAIYDKRPIGQKIWDVTWEVLADVPRALKTTLDMSATLRQGIVLGARHPIRFQQAFKESFKQMISEDYFNKALDTMKLMPEYRVSKDAGLHISDPRKLFGHREEYFLSQLADKIPFIGRFVKASNRAYAGMLNTLRFNVFNDLASSFAKTGQASKTNLKALADFINTGTGRGSLLNLEQSATLLSKLLFAPRFIMSRVQFMNPIWYAKQPKPVRIEALKTFGTFAGTVISIITIAKMGGADVELDPRSSNFGKMKSGNTYYDLTAGFGLYIRLFVQLITGEKKTLTSKKVEELGGDKPFSDTRLDILGRAARGKLAPLFSASMNLLEGKNVVGEKVTLPSEILDQVTPLYLADIHDAMKQRGAEALFTVGIPGFFGVSTQTFAKKKKSLRD